MPGDGDEGLSRPENEVIADWTLEYHFGQIAARLSRDHIFESLGLVPLEIPLGSVAINGSHLVQFSNN